MAKKKKRTTKEKELQRKLEALKANQNITRNSTKEEKLYKTQNNPDINVNKILSDDSIIITEDSHIKKDLLRTTIFTVLVAIMIIALKYYYPSI